ncbi:ribosomal protein S18 acetylase RimI-like enzyme [Kribbella sp. VKM Ac-2527]|uniref:Ribosomal protein S18 acetylase RimI-like enzyme n=1 Tax=Kribbella caucasensis TaxID=2512215 RepID=A0A4R6KNT4_9ACTN|nr:GNAT family N-acetyltransferase [Kribbella sp. VKM Ac-2527]TDO52676.1 ribosomal protein S18 acetylase RimI-like enzyme [Kribbella sp. VKM Ac-2527]
MTTDIRLAAPDEYAATGELAAEAYAADGFVPAGSDYGDVLRNAADRAANAELWVAADGFDLLGTVTYCAPGSTYREISQDGEGEFRMLAVSAKARGLGLGTALTHHCIQRSRDLGLSRLVLCSASYMTTAHRLYDRLGFIRTPDRDWSPLPTVRLHAFALDL